MNDGYLFLAFPRWHDYSKALDEGTLTFSDLGYSCDQSEFMRVTKRFRAACGYESSIFHRSINQVTARGYHALMKHFMVYSSLERYMVDCLAYERHKWHDKQLKWTSEDLALLNKALIDLDVKGNIFDFLVGELKDEVEGGAGHIRRLKYYYNGVNNVDWYIVSRALRNFFVHGDLTANPGKAKSEELIPFVELLTEHIIASIRNDFESRLIRLIGSKED